MRICNKCVLPENYPGVILDDKGVCNFCNNHKSAAQRKVYNSFDSEEELIESLSNFKSKDRKYDVLVPLSGGVDSSNALITIVEKYKLRPLAYHNDHGYEDSTATENVKKLCKKLNVDLLIVQQDLSFMKKLWKYVGESNVWGVSGCYVCGNILFLNSLEIANKYNIPLLVNGYSKGQATMINDQRAGVNILEKILDIVKGSGDKEFFLEFIRKYDMLEKKAYYKSKEDLEDTNRDGVLVIPFYIFNFYRSNKEELEKRVKSIIDWKPLSHSFPNRTTNCKMVWLNTFMDLKKSGFSMYHDEYSEQIRVGEISREQALKDLDFNPPEGLIEELAKEIELDLNKPNYESKNDEIIESNKLDIDFEF